MQVEIVSATRRNVQDFKFDTPLGVSLIRLSGDERLIPRIAFENTRGLPEIYNFGIEAAGEDSAMVFMHDDVWIDDYHFVDRVIEGVSEFDVIGVAGNRRRLGAQPAWMFTDLKFTPDEREHLSGTIAHGKLPFGQVSRYGSAPAACELLDGVFMAARKKVLTERGVSFDPRFKFHFYDLDVCRTARRQGLKLATWPIAITHQSDGSSSYGHQSWQEGYKSYIANWGD